MHRTFALFFTLTLVLASLQVSEAQYKPSREPAPAFPREFRAAWVATVFNIDWPSKKGLSANAQKNELIRILNKAQQLKLNAIIFQVRPNADALYNSSIEPWSPWLTGTMGKSPGYDPLAFCIAAAHARGIEVHAWFNPFRALPNQEMVPSRDHISRTHRSVIKPYKTYQWINPSSTIAKQRALQVMLDVVRRYDVDGVHIDDYFYPYPDVANGKPKVPFPDGLTPAKRRAHINGFVKAMYTNIKKVKPHVRVGISPFGIWKPGVPRGIEAGIDAYDHLAADSRTWLVNGWCDYMSPQLYWRIQPAKQSYTNLLNWWRQQGKRPVWPGIATARINSTTDPGRPASEIVNQVNYSRTIGKNWVGHVHWSMKSLMQNRGEISNTLAKGAYAAPALVPPMPWLNTQPPAAPGVSAQIKGGNTVVNWTKVQGGAKYAVQARYGKHWYALHVGNASNTTVTLKGSPDAIAVYAVNRYGTNSAAAVVAK